MNLTSALGWTLLYFVWEGALIAVLLAVTLALLRRASSRARYAASCVAMILMLACAAATFLEFKVTALPARHVSPSRIVASPSSVAPGAAPASLATAVADYLPALVWAWIGGVIALSIRSLGGWAVAERFTRRYTEPAPPMWEEKFAALARRLRITRPVRLMVSGLAQVPAVVGCLRPIVLAPASVFTGLTAGQIEALLAHELAHVRRHDYLFNLLQTAAETLLFYHPATWWVSRRICQEREHCCDDLAIEVCGDTITYVRALTALEQMRSNTPRFAMAADAGSLLNRVQRLLRVNETAGKASAGWIAGIGIVAALFVAAVAANSLAQPSAPLPAQKKDTPQAPLASTKTEKKTAKKAEKQSESTSWLDEIQSEGYRDLNVDQLISLKVHGVTGEYIRQMRAAGFRLTADQLVSFRVHGVTADFVNELKQTGLTNVKPDDVISLRVHGADPAWIRQIQSLGYPDVSIDDIVSLRVHGVTPDFVSEARKRFSNISLDKLIQLKQLGILKVPVYI